jgi:predicted HicB family RNase H-like nuclease
MIETKKPTSPKMDKVIRVRVNDNLYSKMIERANKSNLNLSDYIRQATTGRIK